jgi:hypothetical protein
VKMMRPLLPSITTSAILTNRKTRAGLSSSRPALTWEQRIHPSQALFGELTTPPSPWLRRGHMRSSNQVHVQMWYNVYWALRLDRLDTVRCARASEKRR